MYESTQNGERDHACGSIASESAVKLPGEAFAANAVVTIEEGSKLPVAMFGVPGGRMPGGGHASGPIASGVGRVGGAGGAGGAGVSTGAASFSCATTRPAEPSGGFVTFRGTIGVGLPRMWST